MPHTYFRIGLAIETCQSADLSDGKALAMKGANSPHPRLAAGWPPRPRTGVDDLDSIAVEDCAPALLGTSAPAVPVVAEPARRGITRETAQELET